MLREPRQIRFDKLCASELPAQENTSKCTPAVLSFILPDSKEFHPSCSLLPAESHSRTAEHCAELEYIGCLRSPRELARAGFRCVGSPRLIFGLFSLNLFQFQPNKQRPSGVRRRFPRTENRCPQICCNREGYGACFTKNSVGGEALLWCPMMVQLVRFFLAGVTLWLFLIIVHRYHP